MKDCWKLRGLNGGLEVQIKNLIWPGYEFNYKIGKMEFTQAYFGYGVRQNDLVFMI